MSSKEGKGSIIVKLVIFVLIVGLVAVILIPGNIWDQEVQEEAIARDNIMSIYESERFYFRNTNSYTTDPAELINTVRADSSILQQQQVVNYTNELVALIDHYLKNKYITALNSIDVNTTSIMDDIDNNKRHFRTHEQISNEAIDLRSKLAETHTTADYANYTRAILYIDSLKQLRRDLSDYSLQMGASKAAAITDTLSSFLNKINVSGLVAIWNPLSSRLSDFTYTVNRSDISEVTSVADRIKDFKKKSDDSFNALEKINVSVEVQNANNINNALHEIYNRFLTDFIVTSKFALYRLSDSDSLILHLTEENFFSPISNEEYKIIISDDSTSVKVESPVLLEEAKEKALPIINKITELQFMPTYTEYLDTLEAIKAKAYATRKKIRKNTDIFIKYKEIEEIVKAYQDISIIGAYRSLSGFTSETQTNESYSDLKNSVEEALNGIRISRQAYADNFFGNLDTLHADLILAMQQYNELLSNVRRLPKDIENFDSDISTINDLLAQIKNKSSASLVESLENLDTKIGEVLTFAVEGKMETVYYVFKKRIENPGYIFQNSKSWEEKEE